MRKPRVREVKLLAQSFPAALYSSCFALFWGHYLQPCDRKICFHDSSPFLDVSVLILTHCSLGDFSLSFWYWKCRLGLELVSVNL